MFTIDVLSIVEVSIMCYFVFMYMSLLVLVVNILVLI